MPLRPTALLLLALLSTASPTPGAAPPGLVQADKEAMKELGRWTMGFRRAPSRERHLVELERILKQLERSSLAGQTAPEPAAEALLQVACVALEEEERSEGTSEQVLARARTSLERIGNEALLGALSTGVLASRSEEPGRRRAAARLLRESSSSQAVGGLLMGLRARDPGVRRACLEALVGREEEAVHLAMARRVGAVEPPMLELVEQHFGTIRLQEESLAAAPLAEAVTGPLLSSDWREAVQALRFVRALPDPSAVPLLIQSLELWGRRVESGQPVRRIQYEIVEELERRSGRSIGPRHQRWRTWWNAVQAGHVREAEAPGERTEAAFFGISAVSDRIVFVIDRSGSMAAQFAGSEPRSNHSRYDEAVEQMIGYLEGLGERTEFGIVLFSSMNTSWNLDLAPATPGNLNSARSWLRRQRPDGGTALRGAVEQAVSKSIPSPRKRGRRSTGSEADTVIVLCDGATAEGPGWVSTFMAERGRRSRIAFHGIQIGGSGDGTLRALSEASGGQLVQVYGR